MIIKIFEEFSGYYESEELYTKISLQDFDMDGSVPIDKYINQLNNLLSKYFTSKYEKRRELGGPMLRYRGKSSSMSPFIDIRLFDDDWFLVGLWYMDGGVVGKCECYKCDQLYGVEKLLKDRHII